MPIHHATIKKAEANNITLVENRDNPERVIYTATKGEGKSLLRISHPVAKVVVDGLLLLETLKLEYPVIAKFDYDLKDDQFEAYIGKELVWENEELPDLADLLDAIAENGYDLEAGPRGTEKTEEEDDRSSVVPASFKKKYKDEGHPDDCGDWLAEQLKKYCHKKQSQSKTTFQLDMYTDILKANKVDLSGTWASNRNRGWQGRFRMASRNVLVKVVADAGKLIIPAAVAPDNQRLEINAPTSWSAKNKSVPKRGAKQASK